MDEEDEVHPEVVKREEMGYHLTNGRLCLNTQMQFEYLLKLEERLTAAEEENRQLKTLLDLLDQRVDGVNDWVRRACGLDE